MHVDQLFDLPGIRIHMMIYKCVCVHVGVGVCVCVCVCLCNFAPYRIAQMGRCFQGLLL